MTENKRYFEHMAGVHPLLASAVLFLGVLIFGLVMMGVFWSAL
jgi:hypothetical protein